MGKLNITDNPDLFGVVPPDLCVVQILPYKKPLAGCNFSVVVAKTAGLFRRKQ